MLGIFWLLCEVFGAICLFILLMVVLNSFLKAIGSVFEGVFLIITFPFQWLIDRHENTQQTEQDRETEQDRKAEYLHQRSAAEFERQFSQHYQRLPDRCKASSEGAHFGDDLFLDAAKLVVMSGSASTSMLQRHLNIGYTRVARLMELMEQAGIVGPLDGTHPREVLVTTPAELGQVLLVGGDPFQSDAEPVHAPPKPQRRVRHRRARAL